MDQVAVAGGDAGAFLAAMLQRVERQIGELRGFGMAVDGSDAAFFVEFIKHEVDPEERVSNELLQIGDVAASINIVDPRCRSVTAPSL